VRIFRQAPVVTFFGIEPIDEGISTQPKRTSVWIIGVDVLMKKHCDMPVATNDWFGALTGMWNHERDSNAIRTLPAADFDDHWNERMRSHAQLLLFVSRKNFRSRDVSTERPGRLRAMQWLATRPPLSGG